jgi:hypothetical protein
MGLLTIHWEAIAEIYQIIAIQAIGQAKGR